MQSTTDAHTVTRQPRTQIPSLLLVGILCLASLLPIWGATRNWSHRNDDTYITLTYVKSLAAGQGWSFNGGVEALGTTTPLFALSAAILARLFPAAPLEMIAAGMSVAAWIGIAWLIYFGRSALGLAPGPAVVVSLGVLLTQPWWLSSLGMEATLLAFGLILATVLLGGGHLYAAGLVGGLLFLVRPEGIAMPLVAGTWLLWRRRGGARAPARIALGASFPLGLWSLYAVLKFGVILPNSASAKLAQGATWPGRSFIERLVEEWLPPYADSYGISPILSLVWPLFGLGLWYCVGNRLNRPILLVPAWAIVYTAAYAALRAPGYWWYMLPPLYVIQLVVTLGIGQLLVQPTQRARSLGIGLAVLILGIGTMQTIRVIQESEGDIRAPAYLTVASWLRENSETGSSVAFVEIGYLGYFTDNRIIDLVGLVDPRFTERGAQLDLSGNFWEAQPDYLLYNESFAWLMGPIVTDPRFTERYRTVAEFPAEHLATPLLLYQRGP